MKKKAQERSLFDGKLNTKQRMQKNALNFQHKEKKGSTVFLNKRRVLQQNNIVICQESVVLKMNFYLLYFFKFS